MIHSQPPKRPMTGPDLVGTVMGAALILLMLAGVAYVALGGMR